MYKYASFLFLSLLFLLLGAFSIQAQSPAELEERISQRNAEIQKLEKEIQEFQKQINTLSTQANSLSSTIKSLELTQRKLETDIKVTENKISAKNLEIQELSYQISDKEETMSDDRRIITQTFAHIHELGDRSVPEMLLGSASLSVAWNSLENLSLVQKGLTDRINQLKEIKADLEVSKTATEKARKQLENLKEELRDQRSVTIQTQNEKNSLLKETKQSEAQYQKLLAEKKVLKEAFEREVLNYESQLRLAVDSSLLPQTGRGVLKFPVDNVYITQHFGNTEFSTANPQIYSGRGHTGVDFRASIGTPIKSAMSGVVSGVGNTDLVRGCYSYGKWIMVKHPNGLSTLYAHLSLPSVATGQPVNVGEIIGYSGNTGYSTGPHLHFGVYATQGVQIKSFDNSVNCKGAIIPLADFKAYLNPLSYL